MATKNTKKKAAKTAKKQTPKTTQSWNNIRGVMRVWAAEKEYKKKSWISFSTSIGKKNEEDEYDNLYFNVLFKKDEAPDVEDGAFEINVKKGFLTLSVYKDGSVHPAVMVLDYELKDADEEDEDDEDLPF